MLLVQLLDQDNPILFHWKFLSVIYHSPETILLQAIGPWKHMLLKHTLNTEEMNMEVPVVTTGSEA